MSFNDIYYWTDSDIVLSWIATEPRESKTFVCYRISEIQSLTKIDKWHHVSSSNNSADIIPRRINPNNLE